MSRHTLFVVAAATFAFASPALAQDDEAIARGESAFNQCQSCHVVADDEGNVLAGRNGRTGPNLYGVVGRVAGTYPDFRYGDGIVSAGEMGLNWDEETMVAYLQDPTSFLREYTGDRRARGNMSFRVRNENQARDLYAFLATFSEPAADEAPAEVN